MVKLYIMCGLPFSGKSTLAKKIAEHTNSKLISFDEVWVAKEKELGISKDVEGWKLIREEAHREVIKTLEEDMSVVYDDTNIRFEHREKLRSIAKDLNTQYLVVYMDTPLNIIRERRAANKSTKERHEVDLENLKSVINQLQVPVPQENLIAFKPDTDMEAWLKNLDTRS